MWPDSAMKHTHGMQQVVAVDEVEHGTVILDDHLSATLQAPNAEIKKREARLWPRLISMGKRPIERPARGFQMGVYFAGSFLSVSCEIRLAFQGNAFLRSAGHWHHFVFFPEEAESPAALAGVDVSALPLLPDVSAGLLASCCSAWAAAL